MRGHAFGDERREARCALREQLLLARGAHRAHAREDAAAGARDAPRRSARAAAAAYSSARVPANTRCVWQSMRPGVTQAPPRSCTSAPRRRGQGRFLAQPLDARAKGEQRAALHAVRTRRRRWRGGRCATAAALRSRRARLRRAEERQVQSLLARALDRALVAGVRVAHDAARRIVPQHPLDAPRGRRRCRRTR